MQKCIDFSLLYVVVFMCLDSSGDKSCEKSLSPPPTPTLFGARLKEMVRQIRKSKKISDAEKENPSTLQVSCCISVTFSWQ